MSNDFSDVLWDRIVSIEYAGEEHVYDIEVEGTHNFVAGHWVKGGPSPFTLQPTAFIQSQWLLVTGKQ